MPAVTPQTDWLLIPFCVLHLLVGSLVRQSWALALPLINFAWALPADLLELTEAEPPPVWDAVLALVIGAPILGLGVVVGRTALSRDQS